MLALVQRDLKLGDRVPACAFTGAEIARTDELDHRRPDAPSARLLEATTEGGAHERFVVRTAVVGRVLEARVDLEEALSGQDLAEHDERLQHGDPLPSPDASLPVGKVTSPPALRIEPARASAKRTRLNAIAMSPRPRFHSPPSFFCRSTGTTSSY